MPANELRTADFDWRMTTFEGARREQLRRWAGLPLEDILRAIEEMQDISQQLGTMSADARDQPTQAAGVQVPSAE